MSIFVIFFFYWKTEKLNIKKIDFITHTRTIIVSFRIYDFDRDGCISKEELYKLLEASLVENSLGIPQEQLGSLVDATFAEADTDGDGKISFEEYRVLVTKHPSMIGNMTITTNIKKN